MYTLGINAALEDPSACLVKDGRIVAAAQEEAFLRLPCNRKIPSLAPHELPFNAIDFCLRRERIVLSDVDHIAYSFNPYALLEEGTTAGTVTVRIKEESRTGTWPRGSEWEPLFLSAVASTPRQLYRCAPGRLSECLAGVPPEGPFVWHFVDHHLAHAASAFFPSPFTESAILTVDSEGEKAATSYSLGSGNTITSLGEVDLPNSLGRLGAMVAGHLGFREQRGEAKLSELSNLGKPAYADEFRRLVRFGENGQYVTQKTGIEDCLGAPRAPSDPIEKKHCDIAASLCMVMQETTLAMCGWLKAETQARNLCLAGTVMLNPALTTFLARNAPFEAVWVQPASGDAGTAPGAALWIDSLERKNLGGPKDYILEAADLGPSFGDEAIQASLEKARLPFRKTADICGETAALLAAGKIIGWFQGRMEFGGRPLGNRSILASPLRPRCRRDVNELKGREPFRPLAAMVTAEAFDSWFMGTRSPFMLFSSEIRPDKRGLLRECGTRDGLCQVQAVRPAADGMTHGLLESFRELAGMPVLVTTSFNPSGRPPACSPTDALEFFWTSGLDAVAIGPYLMEKPVA